MGPPCDRYGNRSGRRHTPSSHLPGPAFGLRRTSPSPGLSAGSVGPRTREDAAEEVEAPAAAASTHGTSVDGRMLLPSVVVDARHVVVPAGGKAADRSAGARASVSLSIAATPRELDGGSGPSRGRCCNAKRSSRWAWVGSLCGRERPSCVDFSRVRDGGFELLALQVTQNVRIRHHNVSFGADTPHLGIFWFTHTPTGTSGKTLLSRRPGHLRPDAQCPLRSLFIDSPATRHSARVVPVRFLCVFFARSRTRTHTHAHERT
jgi:hypothetical protein